MDALCVTVLIRNTGAQALRQEAYTITTDALGIAHMMLPVSMASSGV